MDFEMCLCLPQNMMLAAAVWMKETSIASCFIFSARLLFASIKRVCGSHLGVWRDTRAGPQDDCVLPPCLSFRTCAAARRNAT